MCRWRAFRHMDQWCWIVWQSLHVSPRVLLRMVISTVETFRKGWLEIKAPRQLQGWVFTEILDCINVSLQAVRSHLNHAGVPIRWTIVCKTGTTNNNHWYHHGWHWHELSVLNLVLFWFCISPRPTCSSHGLEKHVLVQHDDSYWPSGRSFQKLKWCYFLHVLLTACLVTVIDDGPDTRVIRILKWLKGKTVKNHLVMCLVQGGGWYITPKVCPNPSAHLMVSHITWPACWSSLPIIMPMISSVSRDRKRNEIFIKGLMFGILSHTGILYATHSHQCMFEPQDNHQISCWWFKRWVWSLADPTFHIIFDNPATIA